VPPGLTNVVAVSAGNVHSLALRADGTVAAWGYDNHGQIDVPADLSNAVKISSGNYHNLAVIGVGRPILAPMVNSVKMPQGVQIFLQARPAGELPISCMWQKDGSPLDGATSAILTLTMTNMSQCGDYSCIASNLQGVTTGSTVHVTIVPLVINSPPQSGTAFIGQPWQVSVEVSGTGLLGYQWQKNGSDIIGATSTTYVVVFGTVERRRSLQSCVQQPIRKPQPAPRRSSPWLMWPAGG